MLLIIAIAYVTALLLPWDLGPWPAILGLSVALLLAGYGASLRAKLWSVPLALAAFFAGLEKPPTRPHVEPTPGLARVDGEVISVRHGEAGASAVVKVGRGEGIGAAAQLSGSTVRVYDLDLPPGTRARFAIRVGKATYFENPSPAGIVALDAKPMASAFLVGEPRVLEAAGPLSRAVHRARATIRRALDSTLEPEAAGVARALVLGEGGAVDRDARAAIRDAGLSHVLAVSGLHVGIVGGGLFVLLSASLARLGCFLDPVRVAAAASIAPSLAFAFVAGGAPSAIRAGTMLSLALFCRAMGRRPKALATLGGAMLIFALFSPEDLPRPAFLLSVLATMSILTMPPATGERFRALHVSWQLSWRTTLATAPIILLYFRTIPISGLASNLVLVPVASATLIPLALAQAALGSIGLGQLTARLFEHTSAAFTGAARAFSSLGLDFTPPPITTAQLVAASVAALAGLSSLSLRPKLWLLAACALVAIGDEGRIRVAKRLDETLRVTVLDVGQGSAAVVELPRGEGVIVADAGPHAPDTGERVVAPFLRARRYDEVRLFVASHAHPDHVGGLLALHREVPVRELWAPRRSARGGATFTHALDTLEGEVSLRLSASEGCETRRYGEVRVEMLAPCPTDPMFYDENEDSLVVRVTLGAHAALLPGDVEHRREAQLAATRGLEATLLVSPHHGSKTSSTEALLRAVAPRVVFVSAGRMSQFGHPHEGPMRRYEAAGAEALVTSERGGLTFVTDGERFSVRATRGPSE